MAMNLFRRTSTVGTTADTKSKPQRLAKPKNYRPIDDLNHDSRKEIHKKNFWIVLAILVPLIAYIFSLSCSSYIGFDSNLFSGISWLAVFITTISMIISLMGLRASTYAEIFSIESYKSARRTAHSHIHFFGDEFSKHLDYLTENINPKEFSGRSFELKFALSTPAYGIGVLEKEIADLNAETESLSLVRFINYIEQWKNAAVKPTGHTLTTRPSFELKFWEPDGDIHFLPDCYHRFRACPEETNLLTSLEQKVCKIIDAELDRLGEIFRELYQMSLAKKIDLKVCYSRRNDNRVFMAKNGENYSGIMVFYSPLSNLKIHNWDWKLAGCSIYDSHGYLKLLDFFNCFDLFVAEKTTESEHYTVRDITSEFGRGDGFLKTWFEKEQASFLSRRTV